MIASITYANIGGNNIIQVIAEVTSLFKTK